MSEKQEWVHWNISRKIKIKLVETDLSLDEIALECEKVFNTKQSDNLDLLFQMGGSSGGARPKIFYKMDGKEWIVKFPSSYDGKILENRNIYILYVQKNAV